MDSALSSSMLSLGRQSLSLPELLSIASSGCTHIGKGCCNLVVHCRVTVVLDTRIASGRSSEKRSR